MKVFFDENMAIHLINSVKELERKDNQIEVLSTKEVVRPSATDQEIVDFIKKFHCALVTQDTDFKSVGLKQQLLKEYHISLVHIKKTNGAGFWEEVRIFYNHWIEVRTKLLKANNRDPIALQVTSRGGVKEL